MKKSIVFFDIDGTLLTDDKKLPSSTKEAIFKLKEYGHEVAIATGRAPFMFEDLRKELDIHTFVSCNGQYVVLNNEKIYSNPLKNSSVQRFIIEAQRRNHPIVFIDQEDMKMNVPEHSHVTESIETLKVNRFPTFDPYYYKERELYQMLLFCQDGEEEQYEREFEDFDFIRWHPVSVDVIPKGGSKAKGIQKIAEKLGIPQERLYAFGDGLNDIEMLSTIKNSVAMGNAVETVKVAAKYVTKPVDEDGISHGLQKVGLL